jgi:hypothetical protein
MQVTYLVIIASELENLKETRGCILFFSLLLCKEHLFHFSYLPLCIQV